LPTHRYEATVRWTGDRGEGTSGLRAYGRDHEVTSGDAPTIRCSADPAFLGDAAGWNPEQLLVVSLSQCHLLWYLGLAAAGDVIVVGYEDHADGVMVETEDGGGHFEQVTLRPVVTVTDASMKDDALALHARAHKLCFIANSVNFPVLHEPRVEVAGG
jgi:organic hydroperoxide reductase OsmC/OhrA